ncbi:unnamed protein product [Amoebophrya sp. A120]|nr:unnamed protein product [Amoebophrya sp. A120]|eukprot:GSA120T00024301001.1
MRRLSKVCTGFFASFIILFDCLRLVLRKKSQSVVLEHGYGYYGFPGGGSSATTPPFLARLKSELLHVLIVVKDSRPNRSDAHKKIRQICTDGRKALEDATARTSGRHRIKVVTLEDDVRGQTYGNAPPAPDDADNIKLKDYIPKKNQFGAIYVKSIFEKALEIAPNADTYTFANSDILFDTSFLQTVATVADLEEAQLRSSNTVDQGRNKNFLIVGRRTNLPLADYTVIAEGQSATTDAAAASGSSSKKSHELHHLIQTKGELFRPDACDYFVVSRSAVQNWLLKDPIIGELVIGRVIYDNYLPFSGLTAGTEKSVAKNLPPVKVIDASETLLALHLMDEFGAYSGGGGGVKDPEDFFFNAKQIGKWERENKRKILTYNEKSEPSHIDGSWVIDTKWLTTPTVLFASEGGRSDVTSGADISSVRLARRATIWWERLFGKRVVRATRLLR